MWIDSVKLLKITSNPNKFLKINNPPSSESFFSNLLRYSKYSVNILEYFSGITSISGSDGCFH